MYRDSLTDLKTYSLGEYIFWLQPFVNKGKIWNSLQQKFEPDENKVPYSQATKPYAQSLEWYLKIVHEDTKDEIIDLPIRHDMILSKSFSCIFFNVFFIGKNPNEPDCLVIGPNEENTIDLKLTSTADLDRFLKDVDNIIDPEIKQLKKKHGDINKYVETINSNDDTYYFINVFTNKRDLSYARGSIFKAMSIASKYRYIELFDTMLEQALNNYLSVFDVEDDDSVNLEKAEKIMSQLFIKINSDYDVKNIRKVNFFEKRVFNDIKDYSLLPQLKDKTKSAFANEIIVSSVWLDTDQISNSTSLRNFILKFGERVMLIFDHILREKRVLFIQNKGSNITADYVFACVEMFCPPLIGLLRRAFPCVNLNNLDFLDIPGYIAGTNNQVFESRSTWYDLCWDVESSKIKLSKDSNDEFVHPEEEEYYEMDYGFIQKVISRIKSKNIYDFEIKDCFSLYIQNLLTCDNPKQI